jgi:hypothetical protein
MWLPAFKLLVPLAILILLLLAVFKTPPPIPDQSQERQGQPAQINLDPSRFLIRPFYSQGREIALALDGGGMPVGSGQVPSIVVGGNVLRTVHLAWVHDWSNVESRTSFKNLQALYASEEGASLPALRIYLNPVFSDAAGETVHRAMLQVYFRSDSRDSFFTLANEMSAGSLATNADAIRSRVELIDPILVDDWDSRLSWLESDIEQTFSIARVQQARNAAITAPEHVDQLTSMLATLPPLAEQQELNTFLQQANASQRAWLQTLLTPDPNAPAVR